MYLKAATTHTPGKLVVNGAESLYNDLGFKGPAVHPNGTISDKGYSFFRLMRVETFDFPYADNIYGKSEADLNVKRIVQSWNNFDAMKNLIGGMIDQMEIAARNSTNNGLGSSFYNQIQTAKNFLDELEKPVDLFGNIKK